MRKYLTVGKLTNHKNSINIVILETITANYKKALCSYQKGDTKIEFGYLYKTESIRCDILEDCKITSKVNLLCETFFFYVLIYI